MLDLDFLNNKETQSTESAEGSTVLSSEAVTTDDGYLEKKKGLSWIVAGLLLSGELAGAGVIALPLAIRDLGFYFGLIFLFVCAVMCMYTAIVLGRCWMIMQKYWPSYRHHCRDPYAQIGYRAYGLWMKHLVEIILNIGSFGTSVILVVISGHNLTDAVYHFAKFELDYCYSAAIVTVIITPCCLLRSPKDFWWALIIGILCTIGAVTLAMIGISNDITVCKDTFTVPKFDYTSAFASLGNVVLAFGGHAAFPTVQHDMKQPLKFGFSAVLAFSLITCLYFPISLIGNLAYNDNLAGTVIRNIQSSWIQKAVNILITLHCCLTVILIINPVMQTIEKLVHAPHRFGPPRFLIRSGMMVLVLFVAETFPEFGPLMGLAGGVFVATTSFIFPVMFYLKLNVLDKNLTEDNIISRKNRESDTNEAVEQKTVGMVESIQKTSNVHLLAIGIISLVGSIVMVMATVFAIKDLATASFRIPCYLKWIGGLEDVRNVNKTQMSPTVCCGQFSNISLDTCTPLQFDE